MGTPPESAWELRDLGTRPWRVVDDGVMGGRSAGRARGEASALVFEGELSLEQGGGFSSVRTELGDERLPAGCARLRARVRGDGRPYSLRLWMDGAQDGVSYAAPLPTHDGEEHWVELALAEFEARFRGRPAPQAPPLDPARVSAVGLLLADGQAGRFRLELLGLEAP